MTDADGDLVQHYGYMPFGNERYENNTQAFSVTNRYTGQQLDEETGLYFYGSRYYDLELARFIQPDSVVPGGGSQSLNRYTYCGNNPLLFTDPSGHFGIIAAIIIGAIIGGSVSAAQGGNFWKGALAGAIAGAFGGYAYASGFGIVGTAACAAAGGAIGALVTGGDPGMAAAMAGITAGIAFGLFSNGGAFGSFEGSATEQYLKQLAASTGVGALVGGVTAEISGGSFGEGAMWGAASAAAGYVVSKLIIEFMEPLASCNDNMKITYKQKSSDRKRYLVAQDVKDIEKLWKHAKNSGDLITFFEAVGHSVYADHEGIGLLIGKDSIIVGISDIENNVYGIKDYADLIQGAFDQQAIVELEACGTNYDSSCIAYAFKEILPNATVRGWTGKSQQWCPGIWETRRYFLDLRSKFTEVKLNKK